MHDILHGRDLLRRLSVYERATRDLSAYVPWSCDQDTFEKESGVVRKIVDTCEEPGEDVT